MPSYSCAVINKLADVKNKVAMDMSAEVLRIDLKTVPLAAAPIVVLSGGIISPDVDVFAKASFITVVVAIITSTGAIFGTLAVTHGIGVDVTACVNSNI